MLLTFHVDLSVDSFPQFFLYFFVAKLFIDDVIPVYSTEEGAQK